MMSYSLFINFHCELVVCPLKMPRIHSNHWEGESLCQLSLTVSNVKPGRSGKFDHLIAYTWTRQIKNYIRIFHNVISVVSFGLNIFCYSIIVSIFHVQPCVISNYKRLYMKLHYVVLYSVLHVTQGIYLYNIESIKGMWNSWKIIRASNSAI